MPDTRPHPWELKARSSLANSLKRPFVHEAHWPIEPAELAALVDMGMSNELIASYFNVELSRVLALRDQYRIIE